MPHWLFLIIVKGGTLQASALRHAQVNGLRIVRRQQGTGTSCIIRIAVLEKITSSGKTGLYRKSKHRCHSIGYFRCSWQMKEGKIRIDFSVMMTFLFMKTRKGGVAEWSKATMPSIVVAAHLSPGVRIPPPSSTRKALHLERWSAFRISTNRLLLGSKNCPRNSICITVR